MGNTFQSVFHAILKCMINHICSFKGPDGRSAWSLSPSEVEDAFFLKYPPHLPFKMCPKEILVAKIEISLLLGAVHVKNCKT